MAITKVGAMTDPPVAGDYTILQAKLDAYAKQIGNQGMILTEWTQTSAVPNIAIGSYITHGGTLFVVDTEDFAVPAPAGDGTYYLKVAVSGATLALSWVASLAGYTWNAIYNGLYHADESQILPYQLVMAGGTLTKRKITNLMQVGGLMTVDYAGNVLGSANFGVSGAINGASLGVSGAISGASLGVTGAISGASINTGIGDFEIGQNLRTTDNVNFANLNPPVDNNDASMPSVGIGGFSYATASAESGTVQYPSITIGSGGTWVYIASSSRSDNSIAPQAIVGRIAGGSSVQGLIQSGSGYSGRMSVIAWRIA